MIAGYIRVSDQKLKTDGERRQDINRQRDKITKFAESMNWEKPIFFSDDGISAYKEDYNSRPQFVKMLHEIRARRIQRVIVEDLTRWSRRIEDGLKTLKEVTEKAKVTSLAEGEIGITIPEQWFKTTIGLLMAEWSSKVASYKVKSGMEKLRLDKTKICKFCSEREGKNIIHLGRHPNYCECEMCLERKGRVKRKEKYRENKLIKLKAKKGLPLLEE